MAADNEITIRQLFEGQNKIEEMLGELSKSLHVHIALTEATQSGHAVRLDGYEARITSLEADASAQRTANALRDARIASLTRPPTPWYTKVSGIVGILSGVSIVIGIPVGFVILANAVADAFPTP